MGLEGNISDVQFRRIVLALVCRMNERDQDRREGDQSEPAGTTLTRDGQTAEAGAVARGVDEVHYL